MHSPMLPFGRIMSNMHRETVQVYFRSAEPRVQSMLPTRPT